ncbi:FtsK/SpoIIIE family protein [Listeria floridensis FSL S10-1187]|uniref:FtsK/SpoIIIE family protein n=1 Tax=Listeria floridensis FSL S10-1187 TaxID=1265817 RepID=A0ABP3B338_9LIST|nr:FtsK/SpoIIIE family protein [Listeria floridensis FSL S10-1187]
MLDVMNKPYKEQPLPPYEAYYIKQGQAERIKLIAPL